MEHALPPAKRGPDPPTLQHFGQYVKSTLAIDSSSAIAETFDLLTLASKLVEGDGLPGPLPLGAHPEEDGQGRRHSDGKLGRVQQDLAGD